MSAKEESKSSDFESMIAELEEIVSLMEDGQPSLDSLVSNYKKGLKLLHKSKSKLSDAEITIRNTSELTTSDE